LKKQEKNKQDRSMAAENLAFGAVASKYQEIRGKHQMNDEQHFIKFLFKEAAPESS
jgi:hypothetical protein